MNKLFAPGKPLAGPMEEILIDLRDSSRSHIVLAVADDATLRREAMAELAERLSGTYSLYEFDYVSTQLLSLPRFCRTLRRDDLPACVFAYGLAELAKQNKDKYEDAIVFLNNHREDIYYTKTAVVLWLTLQTQADLFQRALDFVDWRTADVTFTLPDDWYVEQTTLGNLSIEEAERLRRQARRFEEMLARPNLAPAMRAEFQKQLAFVRKQLGQEEESKKALTESSRTAAALGDYKGLEELYRQHIIDRFSKLTLYSATADTPLAVDLERIFVKLTATQRRRTVTSSATIPWESLGPAGEVRSASPTPPTGPPVRTSLLPGREVPEEFTVTVSINEALNSGRCLAVIGAPGAGKTTLLRYLALTYARQQARERLDLSEERLPVFIVLRDFNRFLDNAEQHGGSLDLSPQLLPRFLGNHTKAIAPHLSLPDDFFSCPLEAGKCIVLLDGLDEVADPAKRARIVEVIAACTRHYQGNRFVVTSRPRGYEGEAKQRLASLYGECTIRDFDDGDMAAFARNWYEAVIRDRLGDTPEATAEAQRQADDLLRAIRADERVEALAPNPLLLSILAMVHQRGVGLPQQRAELYDECTDMLLGYWDQTKGGEAARELATFGELTRNEKRTLLQPIALWFHERGEQGLEAGKEELEREIARQFAETFGDTESKARYRAALFLRVIDERAGLLVERETGAYAFAHLTFQEYLAARAIADRDDYVKFTLQHLHDPWWREVILLEAGHLSDVRHFGRRARKLASDLIRAIRNAGSWLEDVLKRDLLFAARCLCDTGRLGVDDKLRQSILDELITLWRTTPYAPQRKEVADIFAHALPTIDGTRIRIELLHCLDGEEKNLRVAAVETLGQIGVSARTAEIVERLLALISGNGGELLSTAARALVQIGEPSAVEEAMRRVLELTSDHDPWVRSLAVLTFVRIGKAAMTPAAMERLDALTNDPDKLVRIVALFVSIIVDESNGVKYFECLRELTKDKDLDIVMTFVADLIWGATGFSHAEKSMQQLLELTASDTPMRAPAVRVLGIKGKLEAAGTAVTQLISLIADPDPEVRRVAAQALGQVGTTTEITTQLIEFWQAQLADTEYSFGLFRRPCDVAYEELRRIAAQREGKPEP